MQFILDQMAKVAVRQEQTAENEAQWKAEAAKREAQWRAEAAERAALHDRQMAEHAQAIAEHDRLMAEHAQAMAEHAQAIAGHDRAIAQLEGYAADFALARAKHEGDIDKVRNDLRRAVRMSVQEARNERRRRQEFDEKMTQLAAAQLLSEEKLRIVGEKIDRFVDGLQSGGNGRH